MTTTHKILEIIGGTKNQYELLLITNYQNWCEIQAQGSDRLLQQIMLDQSINKWYIAELQKLEQSFLEKNKPLANSKYINYTLMKKKYRETIGLIRRIYPKPLLKKYKLVHKNQLTTFKYN